MAEHRGMSASVIAGDLALFNAYRLIDRSGVGDEVRGRLLEVMDQALFASAAGELIDVDFAWIPDVPRVDDILTMERLKTAVYSFECPLQAGAILAGASEDTVSTLGEFGRDMGIAYQLVDDLLGVFGREEETGKSASGDLREGKRTVLIAYANTAAGWDDVSCLLGAPDLTEADAERLRQHLVACGARAFAEGLARYYANRALARLLEPHVPAALRTELHPDRRRRAGPTRVSGAGRDRDGDGGPRLRLYDDVAQQAAGLVIRRYSTSFGMASRLLGAGVRQHVENIYALVRVADEIVDGGAGEAGSRSRDGRAAARRAGGADRARGRGGLRHRPDRARVRGLRRGSAGSAPS